MQATKATNDLTSKKPTSPRPRQNKSTVTGIIHLAQVVHGIRASANTPTVIPEVGIIGGELAKLKRQDRSLTRDTNQIRQWRHDNIVKAACPLPGSE